MEALIEALVEYGLDVVIKVVQALGKLGDARALEPLEHINARISDMPDCEKVLDEAIRQISEKLEDKKHRGI